MQQLRIYDKIEKGKQVGKIYSFELEGQKIWSSVGIQKWKGLYKVYIDEIYESKMDMEEYEKEIIREFSDLDDAILFIEKNSELKFCDLMPLKGQKIFNPAFR